MSRKGGHRFSERTCATEEPGDKKMASQIIAIEEHFTSPALRDAVAPRPGPIQTRLDEPVYIHPSPVKPAVAEAFFKDHAAPLAGAPLGFGLETLAHTFRLITSGVFDQYPTLKIIVGHLGETAPYTLWRTEHNLEK